MFTGTFIATSTSARIRFSSATDQSNKDWYIDGVSIVPIAGGTNTLINGNFETGTSVGWQILSCNSGCFATIVASSTCLGGSGWCYNNACTPATNIQFIEQYFATTNGAVYNVTYWLRKGGSGLGAGTGMYVNVF